MFGLCCSLAWQDVCTRDPRTSTVTMWKLLAISFNSIIANYPSKQYAQDNLFKHFPDNTWPTDFLALVRDTMDKAPAASWLNQTKVKELLHRGAPEQKQAYFGNAIKNQSDTNKSFIITRYVH
jgi:hypothetical protein